MDIDWDDPHAALGLLGSQVGLWRWDFATNRVQWSDYLLGMVGIERSDFVENFSFFAGLLHPDDHPVMEAEVKAHLATSAPFRLRCRMRHADGRYITTLAQGTSMRDESGSATTLIGTVVDVSREVVATEQLLESERSLRSVAENMPGAVFRYAIHPDGTDSIEYMSPGCFDIFEVTANQIEGDPSELWAQVHADDLDAMQESVARSGERLERWFHRWRITTPSGRTKHVEGRGMPARLVDGTVLWHTLILDVSEEAAVRDELTRQQQLLAHAQRIESIGRLSGGIAHDFNNLLAIVSGNAELAGDATDAADRRQHIEAVLEACGRGSELTRRLLSFARRSNLDPKVVDLRHDLTQLVDMARRVLPATIAVSTDTAPDLRRTIVDLTLLESAVLNLCINARDAMLAGGSLRIEIRNEDIEPRSVAALDLGLRPGAYVSVAVIDSGEGIPPEDLDRVAEPFYSTKGPDVGSGMGLAMVDGFARQSGGGLMIESELGVGTTVTMLLPATFEEPDDREPSAVDADTPSSARTARILIVDDEPAIRRVLEQVLSADGHAATTAADGDTALAEHGDTAQDFDILLTDFVMPGELQGPALAAELTARNPALRVVLMSGYSPLDPALQAQDNPTYHVLMKPVSRDHLLGIVDDIMAERDAS